MNEMRINATEFKARCLALLDQVAETHETLVVTKRGKPVARLSPVDEKPDLRGTVRFLVSDEELIRSSMGPWDMERDGPET